MAAGGQAFAALSRLSRRGASATMGAPTQALAGEAPVAAAGVIGGVPPEMLELPARAVNTAPPPPSPFAALAAKSARQAAESGEFQPRDYETKASDGSPFERLVQEPSRRSVASARQDIHAIKVLARLVMAIARKPGSGVPDAVKSRSLTGLLRATRTAASRLAIGVAPTIAHHSWVQAHAQEGAATIVAGQWERDEGDDLSPVDAQLEELEDVFRQAESQPDLRAALDDLGAAGYVEATTQEVASARVVLSFRLACWDLYGAIHHPCLGAAHARYTYDRPAAEIVAKLAPHILAIAREANIRIDSLDMRTAHMQGSLRRVADLMGAEYVTRTRQLMNWIAEKDISNADFLARRASARDQFEERIVPDLIEWTRRNFLAVESLAGQLLEEKDQHEQVNRHAP